MVRFLFVMDFSPTVYQHLLATLQAQAYTFQTFEAYLQSPAQNPVVLRHDIDKLPANALQMAQMEHELGVRASYFFRAVLASFDEPIMTQIKELGHEIGYHYEDLTIAKGDPEKAIRHFERQLIRFRKIYPVKTICMHGSPLSRYDNRDLWKSYDYRDFGIIGEPYFDIDFDEVFYLTDTGRSWNNSKISVRDKIIKKKDKNAGIKKVSRKDAKAQRTEEKNVRLKELETKKRGRSFDNFRFKSTFDIIEAAERGLLPDKVMLTTHPQRWDDRFGPWVKELVWQNVKNVVKRAMLAYWNR